MQPLSRKDPYRLHHLALGSLLADIENNKQSKIFDNVRGGGLDEHLFLDFLQRQGLAPMWDDMLRHSDSPPPFSKDFTQALKQSRLHAAGLYLAQSSSLSLIKQILDEASIPHVVYKGAHNREQYYIEPALRPAIDIDILVAEQHKFAAISALKQQGYNLFAKQEIVSHEVNLNKGAVTIDLHWDIMRPGRTQKPIVNELLKAPEDYGNYWGMNNEATLFVMLVHPVFAKYGTAPQASLVRLIDIVLLLEKTNIQWDKVFQLLECAGLKTAAWVTLKWLEKFTGRNQTPDIMGWLKPGIIRQKYFCYWLDKNLTTLLLQYPGLIQLGFTLPAHDQLKGAVQAIRQARKLKLSQDADLKYLFKQVGT